MPPQQLWTDAGTGGAPATFWIEGLMRYMIVSSHDHEAPRPGGLKEQRFCCDMPPKPDASLAAVKEAFVEQDPQKFPTRIPQPSPSNTEKPRVIRKEQAAPPPPQKS